VEVLEETYRLLGELREAVSEAVRGQPRAALAAALQGEVYTDAAFERAEECPGVFTGRGLLPADHVVLHHLAIMYHARAYDLENAESDAGADWRRALELWAELQRRDSFWAELEQKAQQLFGPRYRAEELARLRDSLPRYLLEVHKALVLEYARTASEKARGHMQIILEAPFDGEVKEDLRREIFGSLVDPGAFAGALETREFERAEEMVEVYLALDPAYLPAMCQMLEVYNKWHDHLWAAQPKDWRQIQRVLERANPHAERLERAAGRGADPVARARLGEYWFNVGLTADDRPKPFDEAVRSDRKPSAGECDDALGAIRQTIEAYRKADSYNPGLNRRGNRLRAAYLTKAQICYVRGMLYGGKDDLREAEAALKEAERLARDAGDDDMLAAIKDVRENVAKGARASGEARDAALLEEAKRDLEGRRFRAAVEKLDGLLRSPSSVRGELAALLLRAQAYMALGEWDDALRDVGRAWEKARAENDREALEAVEKLLDILKLVRR
jgi:tetratricopeptide (TPR) repeat protein